MSGAFAKSFSPKLAILSKPAEMQFDRRGNLLALSHDAP